MKGKIIGAFGGSAAVVALLAGCFGVDVNPAELNAVSQIQHVRVEKIQKKKATKGIEFLNIPKGTSYCDVTVSYRSKFKAPVPVDAKTCKTISTGQEVYLEGQRLLTKLPK